MSVPSLRSLAEVVEVRRGDFVESLHLGAVAVADSSGRLLASCGDPGLVTCVRSAAKPFQAHPLLVAGGAERFALTDPEIALTCSSHFAEPFHVAAAESLLARSGSTVADLHCGAHEPGHAGAARDLLLRGEEPTAVHNNCSGKHAGMLLASVLKGYPKADYWKRGSPLQLEVLGWVSRYLGLPAERIGLSVDGCSLPAFNVPLSAMATGYARLLEEDDDVFPLLPEEREARRRIALAMRSRPEYVRGTGSITTNLMRFFRGQLLAKEGAEAFYALALPPSRSADVRRALLLPPGPARAVGIALKVADGYDRGRPPVILESLSQAGVLPDELPPELAAERRPEVRNVRGDVVGELRPVFRLAAVA